MIYGLEFWIFKLWSPGTQGFEGMGGPTWRIMGLSK